ncbi:MAG TPA: peptidylprolyl isomerase [Opitutaceae bacterium]|nr:peptidylprolyl isomerase [Opitutaceae bacterium]
MMHRRSVALTLSAFAGVAASVFAQPAPPPVGDNLNLRFANGIAAIAEDKVITVDDVRREIGQYIPNLEKTAKSQKDFDDQLAALQDSVIQELIDRVLIIKEFYKEKDGKEVRHIPISYVDNRIADIQAEQFDNDRSKFLAYLRSRGTTLREYRREQEEDIIYHYMQGQQRKSQSIVSPVRIETFYKENKDRFYEEDKVHLRLIQISRNNSETDAELKVQADNILARIRGGEKFEDLAKEFSKDARRSKGGDWGWQRRSDFRKEFSDAAFALKKGEVSDPIILPEGCFLLFAEDRKFAGIQPIDEVRDQIERILISQMTRSSQERWLERLRRNGYIKYY